MFYFTVFHSWGLTYARWAGGGEETNCLRFQVGFRWQEDRITTALVIISVILLKVNST